MSYHGQTTLQLMKNAKMIFITYIILTQLVIYFTHVNTFFPEAGMAFLECVLFICKNLNSIMILFFHHHYYYIAILNFHVHNEKFKANLV